MTKPCDAENAILDDLKGLGISVDRLLDLDMTTVDPIVVRRLASWFPRVGLYRSALLYRLGDWPAWCTLFDDFFVWWVDEDDEYIRTQLTSCVTHCLTSARAGVVWREFRSRPARYAAGRSALLSRLASAPVRSEVCDYIVQLLAAGDWYIGELRDYTRVNDPRISQWLFTQAQNAQDREVRKWCAKIIAPKSQPPPWLEKSSSGPPENGPKIHAEVSLDHVDAELKGCPRVFDTRIPKLKKDLQFLTFQAPDSWFTGVRDAP